jgi:hypothetical protein
MVADAGGGIPLGNLVVTNFFVLHVVAKDLVVIDGALVMAARLWHDYRWRLRWNNNSWWRLAVYLSLGWIGRAPPKDCDNGYCDCLRHSALLY